MVNSNSLDTAFEEAESAIRAYCEQFGHVYTPFFELYEMEEVCDCIEVFSFVHAWNGTVEEFVRERLPHLIPGEGSS